MNVDLKNRVARCLLWSVVIYETEAYILRKKDQTRVKAFEMWVLRKMEGISWLERLKNDDLH